jgi:OmpA-OmpF porin, OOP family
MFVHRTLQCLVGSATAALCWTALAQQASPAPATFAGTGSVSAVSSVSAWPSRSYLGLHLGRTRTELSCGLPGFACEPRMSTHLYAGYSLNRHVAVELGYLDASRAATALPIRTQAATLGLVGQTRLGEALGAFARVGTSYGRNETAVLGAGPAPVQTGFGVSYGAGLSWAFSRRGSATLGWDSHDLLMPGGGRDTVHSTNLGLQWRY